jgi:hypothetical protein
VRDRGVTIVLAFFTVAGVKYFLASRKQAPDADRRVRPQP